MCLGEQKSRDCVAYKSVLKRGLNTIVTTVTQRPKTDPMHPCTEHSMIQALLFMTETCNMTAKDLPAERILRHEELKHVCHSVECRRQDGTFQVLSVCVGWGGAE